MRRIRSSAVSNSTCASSCGRPRNWTTISSSSRTTAWAGKLLLSDYGVPVAIHSAPGPQKSMAYSFSFPIATPNDVDLLTPRTFDVDRQESLWRKRLLEDIVGEVLPVRLGNIDPFVYEFDCGTVWRPGFYRQLLLRTHLAGLSLHRQPGTALLGLRCAGRDPPLDAVHAG